MPFRQLTSAGYDRVERVDFMTWPRLAALFQQALASGESIERQEKAMQAYADRL